MKAMITLLRVILVGIWVLALAVSLGLYFDGHTPPRLPGGYAPWTVADGAMEPSYASGDLVILNMEQEAQPGDAVLARGENGLALSRIIGTVEGQFILRADGGGDSVLAWSSEVEGVCLTYLPGCGAAAEFLQSLPGILLVCLGGLALFLLPELLFRKDRAPRKAAQSKAAAPRPNGPGRGGYTPRH